MNSNSRQIRVSVPSSSMLFGEHAVLRSKHAIVTAIDRFLTLEFVPCKEPIIEISSGPFFHRTSLSTATFPIEFRFIAAAIHEYKKELSCGFRVTINSDIPQTVGLGSSAAVTVAIIAALESFLSRTQSIDLGHIMQKAIQIIRTVQEGVGSGADVASVIYGGVILFHADSLSVSKIIDHLPLVLAYSGNKTPTQVVIKKVQEEEQLFTDIYRNIFSSIEAITQQALSAIKNGDLLQLGLCMNMAQGCMEALQVSNQSLSKIVWQMRSYPNIYGAKISGSGLGDSVVALGSLEEASDLTIVPGKSTSKGLQIEVQHE